MSRFFRLIAIPSVLLAGVLITVTACKIPAKEAPDSASTLEEKKPLTLRDKGANNVTLEATPATPEYLQEKGHPPEHIGFIITLHTSKTDLDLKIYDLVSLALLRDHLGRETPAIGWEPLSDETGHRSGILFFPARGREGQRVIRAEGFIELLVRNLAGTGERVLRWTPPLFPGKKC